MNNCMFLGRITKDLELMFAGTNGTAILKFSLAVNRKFKKGEADFINIIAFGKTAENINNFFKKGDMILLKTHVQTGSYDAKDGTKRYTTDFIVDSFHFVGGNKKEEKTQELGFEDMMPVDDESLPF